MSVGKLTAAARDVLAERQRHIDSEGWSPGHDDQHDHGEMAWAAISYTTNAAVAAKMLGMGMDRERVAQRARTCPVTEAWPWAPEWWKPTAPRRDLVKAAALIIAEIERLDRAQEGRRDVS